MAKALAVEEVVRNRVWACLYERAFGPCQPLSRRYTVLKEKRGFLQCSCGAFLPPKNRFNLSVHERDNLKEGAHEEEVEEVEDRRNKSKAEAVNEKETKRARVSTTKEQETEDCSRFHERTLRSLCLVVLAGYVDHWIQHYFLQNEADSAEEEEEDEVDDKDDEEGEEGEEEEEEEEQEQEEEEEEEEERDDEAEDKKAIRKLVALYKTSMQILNNQVEAFLRKRIPRDETNYSSPSPSSFSSAPTWLQILPTEVLHDIISLPASPTHNNTAFQHQQHIPQPQQSPPEDCCVWKALYQDRAFAKLLGEISTNLWYGSYGAQRWEPWMANPLISFSSSSASSAWQLVGEEGLSELVLEEESNREQAERMYIDVIAMMKTVRCASSCPGSSSWEKLLLESNERSDWDSSGVFAYHPTVERISCWQQEQEGKSGLVLRAMEETLLFVTFAEVGWKGDWDVFLVGVSPLSGRLVGLRSND